MVINPWLLKKLLALRGFMTKLADFMIAGRAAGAWNQEPGPQIQPLLGNPISKVKGAVVKVVVKKAASEVLKKIDTPEERQELSGRAGKIEGISGTMAWILSLLVGFFLEAVFVTGFDTLIAGDYKAWASAVLHVFAARFLIFIQAERNASVQTKE